jgi:hypothetical protein
MFQAKTTRIGLSLVLTLVLSFASSAVALAGQKPAVPRAAVEPATTWTAWAIDVLLARLGGRIEGVRHKAGMRIDDLGLALRVASCIESEDGTPCGAGDDGR